MTYGATYRLLDGILSGLFLYNAKITFNKMNNAIYI